MASRTSIEAFLSANEQRDLLRFLTAGSVDDGKSTLIGRLLHDSRGVYEDHLDALVHDSERHGSAGSAIDYALLLDGLEAEREQGITIDVAYRYFSTSRRQFIIADTPGHEQYTRNMATGASTCDLAVILVDAQNGVRPQTRRHSFIASLLGIKHIVVAVNKMDTVDYRRDVFEGIQQEYADFAARLDVTDLHFIPISAVHGDNVVEVSANMPWFNRGALLEYLETVHVAGDRNLIDLRFPVQCAWRPDQNFRGYCGTVASGILHRGDEVLVLPSGARTRVQSLVTFDGELEEAFPPMAVTVTLADDVAVNRGDMLVRPQNVPHVDARFDAMLVWMAREPMELGSALLIKHGTSVVPGHIEEIRYRVNVNTIHREPAQRLNLNDIGRVRLLLHKPLAFDAYARNRRTGCFVLIDRLTNRTLAAGMVLDREPSEWTADRSAALPTPACESLSRHDSLIQPAERRAKFSHAPATVWLTGVPKSGKSTIAYALERRLFDLGCATCVLDGENMRLGLSTDLGFGASDRAENVRRTAAVARLLNDAGLIAIVAMVSPYREDRCLARQAVGDHVFLEVAVDASRETCQERDAQGLYRKAEHGEIRYFSGVTAPYERPDSPDLSLQTDGLPADEAAERLVAALRDREVISGGS